MPTRKVVPTILVPILLGVVGLLALMSRPRFSAFHTVDVVQLLGLGMCFGVALAGIFALLRAPRAQA